MRIVMLECEQPIQLATGRARLCDFSLHSKCKV
jgi:hypothetical protein